MLEGTVPLRRALCLFLFVQPLVVLLTVLATTRSSSMGWWSTRTDQLGQQADSISMLSPDGESACSLSRQQQLFLRQIRDQRSTLTAFNRSTAAIRHQHQDVRRLRRRSALRSRSREGTSLTINEEGGDDAVVLPAAGGGGLPCSSSSFSSVFSVVSVGALSEAYLAISVPIAPVQLPVDSSSGIAMFVVPADTTRVCVDVGAFVSSPSAQYWWSQDDKTFVVALEPNPLSVGALRTRLATPSSHRERILYTNRDRFVLIPAAASNEEGFSQMQLGMDGNRTDVASLFGFKSRYLGDLAKRATTVAPRKRPQPQQGGSRGTGGNSPALLPTSPVPVIPLSSVLERIPWKSATGGEFGGGQWDTLKIDAQGADALVVEGADLPTASGGANRKNSFIERFLCVVGEFDTSAYRVFDDEQNPRRSGRRKTTSSDDESELLFPYKRRLVQEHGFVMIDQRFFVNPRFESVFRRGPEAYLCGAHDERRRHAEIITVLDELARRRRRG